MATEVGFDANRRWPKLLAARLQALSRYQNVAVVNHGISGNRTLHDLIGRNALARFDRDVLSTPGARWLVLLEGINNIGIPGAFGLAAEHVSASDTINGHRQFKQRPARGLAIECQLGARYAVGGGRENPLRGALRGQVEASLSAWTLVDEVGRWGWQREGSMCHFAELGMEFLADCSRPPATHFGAESEPHFGLTWPSAVRRQ